MQNFNLPPALKRYLEEYLPVLREIWSQLESQFGPAAQEGIKWARNVWQQLAEAGTGETVGGTFRHLCIVGLNKSEMLLAGEAQSVLADNWQDLADDSLKRNLATIFFAPRGLDGQPVNPHLFLMGEKPRTEVEEGVEDNAVALAEQAVGAMSMLDFCRISPAQPNTVNILVAADVLFHWDVKDNYVLPTSPTTWIRDVEQVIKSYPRTTRVTLFTQWETELLTTSDKLKVQRLRELPLDPNTWLNQPTVQEKYGSYILMVALSLAALTYAGLWFQQGQVDELTDQLHVLEQQIPQGGQYTDIEKAISEQEKMFARRDLIGVVVKDSARAIQRAEMDVENFEVRVSEPNDPPRFYVLTVEAKKDAYNGWLQEEPIARALLLQSATLDAVRKPPATSGGFKLEGLVDAAMLQQKYRKIAPKLTPAKVGAKTVTSTTVDDNEDDQP